jgi:hypothetical protein
LNFSFPPPLSEKNIQNNFPDEVQIYRGDMESRIRIVNSFHNSIKTIIFTAQIFGLMPISISHKNSANLDFKIISFKFLYTILIQIGISLLCVTSIVAQVNHKIEYGKVGECFFVGLDCGLLSDPEAPLSYFQFPFSSSF